MILVTSSSAVQLERCRRPEVSTCAGIAKDDEVTVFLLMRVFKHYPGAEKKGGPRWAPLPSH